MPRSRSGGGGGGGGGTTQTLPPCLFATALPPGADVQEAVDAVHLQRQQQVQGLQAGGAAHRLSLNTTSAFPVVALSSCPEPASKSRSYSHLEQAQVAGLYSSTYPLSLRRSVLEPPRSYVEDAQVKQPLKHSTRERRARPCTQSLHQEGIYCQKCAYGEAGPSPLLPSLFAHSAPVYPYTATHSPHPPPWPGHSFPHCLLIAHRCTRAQLHIRRILLPGLTPVPYSVV